MSLRNKFFPFFFLLLIAPLSGTPQSLSEEEIFERVFGKRNVNRRIQVEVFMMKRSLGHVHVEVEGNALKLINGEELFQVTRGVLDQGLLQETNFSGWFEADHFNLGISFNEKNLTLEIDPPLEKLSAEERRILSMEENKNLAIKPADFSGAFTVNAENFWASERLGGDYFFSGFDSFLNFKGVVLENQSSYQTNQKEKFYRGDTRLVKDFHEQSIRAQLGDVNYQTIGYQTLRPVGGLNIGRNFNLNPYRTPYPQFSREFIIKTRSKVTYFVNGQLIKSEHLYPGRYTVRDVPLVNGINTITVDIEDDLGRREVIQFQQTTSINLLNPGESKFDITVGRPFEDQLEKRNYIEDAWLTSGFFQYGMTSNFTYAGYFQNFSGFNIFGLESTYASPIGNLNFGAAYGGDTNRSGSVLGIGYNSSIFRPQRNATHHLNLRFELRQNEFIQTYGGSPSRIKNLASFHYSFPFLKRVVWGIGGRYGQKNDQGLTDQYGVETSFNIRATDNINATLFLSKSRDELYRDNELAYIMVHITLPERNQYVSGYTDIKNATQRLTYVKDNLNELNTFKGSAVVENSQDQQIGDADLVYNSKLADIGTHLTATQFKSDYSSHQRFSLRAKSSLVFAKSDEEFSWAISRPVHSSFALFSPNKYLENQKFAVKSSSPFSEGISNFQGRTVFVNLLPYQYRQVSLDPSELDIGHSLGQESFILFPTYKSGHLIHVGAPGQVSVRGLLSYDGNRLPLSSGTITHKSGERSVFFTNRQGRFLMENLIPGEYELVTDKGYKTHFKIKEHSKGLIDIGEMEVE